MALQAVGLKTHIWNNNIRSILLLMGFPVLLLCMIFAFFGLMGILNTAQTQISPAEIAWHSGWGGLAATWYWAFIVAIIWFGIAFLFHGRMIAAAVHSRPVERREYPELYNLLENLCISRGVPMPKLCIMETPALNAFASGINQKTFTITVTRGLLDSLNERELRAVLAHELSHILNRDVRLLIISVIFVGMISFTAELIARRMFWGLHFSRDRGRNQIAAMLIAFLILAVGYFFAIVIRFALSRKREFLADAGAVELTKDPDAMVDALHKISGDSDIENVPDDVKAMFIENPPGFMSLFATHPPIEERVVALRQYAGAR